MEAPWLWGEGERVGDAATQLLPLAALLEPLPLPCRDQLAWPGSSGGTRPTLAGTGSWGVPSPARGSPSKLHTHSGPKLTELPGAPQDEAGLSQPWPLGVTAVGQPWPGEDPVGLCPRNS